MDFFQTIDWMQIFRLFLLVIVLIMNTNKIFPAKSRIEGKCIPVLIATKKT